jgi:hypothetical protein
VIGVLFNIKKNEGGLRNKKKGNLLVSGVSGKLGELVFYYFMPHLLLIF